MAKEKVQELHPKPDAQRDFKKKIASIVYTIKPLIFLEYFYGIYRFQLVDGELRPSSWRIKIFGILSLAVIFLLFVMNFKLPAVMTGAENIIDTMDEVPTVVVLIQYTTSAITASFLVNALNIRIMTVLGELDSMLNVETSSDFYKNSRSETIKFIALFTISHIINVIIDLVTENDIQLMRIIVLPMYYVQKLEIVVFCKYVAMMKSRLLMINKYLKTFVHEQEKHNIVVFCTVRDKQKESDEEYNYIGRPSESNVKIRNLATTYDSIGKVCAMINETFNFQIFMTLVSTFTYVVITIWTSLFYYKQPENYSGELVNIAVWCFSAILNVALISLACERLLLVRNETKVLVNKVIMNYDLPKTMRVQAKAFMELVEAWPLRIFIYDMFSVDITLMLKFVSVSTTYLIVIVQISHFI